jgi:hypothetical protein
MGWFQRSYIRFLRIQPQYLGADPDAFLQFHHAGEIRMVATIPYNGKWKVGSGVMNFPLSTFQRKMNQYPEDPRK